MTLRIKNSTSRTIGFNLCASALERQPGSRWRVVPEGDRICPAILYTLAPGKTSTDSRWLSESLPAGAYRLRATFSDEDGDGDSFTATSNAFVVRG